jgi:hypothetical protein
MRNTAQAAKAFRLCTSSPIDIGSILKFAGTKRLKWASFFVFLFCFLHVGSNPVPKMADVTYFGLS